MRRGVLDTNPAGIALIKRWESFRPNWYTDVAGIWTIGYGTTEANYTRLTGGTRFHTRQISERTAERLLVAHILSDAEPAVERYVNADINSNQFSALVSFVYNVGAGAFRKSTLLKRVNEGRDLEASDEFLRWVYAGGEYYVGLYRRRLDESALFLRPYTIPARLADMIMPPLHPMSALSPETVPHDTPILPERLT